MADNTDKYEKMPTPEEELTGVENVRHDVVTNQGAPDNPENAREIVERGVVNVANPEPSQTSKPPTSSAQAVVARTLVPPSTLKPTTLYSAEQQEMIDAVEGHNRQINSLKEWMEAEENRPETPEERKKRERREKSKRIISAVSDGISALGNLFFTTQYAPSMYDHERGSMKTVDAHLEKLKAEREKNRDKYLNYALKLGDLENQRAATVRELEAQQEHRKLAREKAQREAEEHRWAALLQPDRQREQAGKATKAEQEAITAHAQAEAAPEMQRAKLATERSRKDSYDASAANSRASAASHNRSNVSEFTAWDEYGKEQTFRTKEAAEAFAKQHGTWKSETTTETTDIETRRTPQSMPQQRISTKEKPGGYPAKPASDKGKGYGNSNNRGY